MDTEATNKDEELREFLWNTGMFDNWHIDVWV